MSESDTRFSLKAHVKAFRMPPVHDALVVGKLAPIGRTALQKALELIVAEPFQHVALEDDVVGDLLVRAALLRRLPEDRLCAYVISRIKPLMEPTEILHLDLFPEVILEGPL